MFTKRFWRDASERAIKSAAGATLLVLGAGRVNVLQVDWSNTLGFAAGAALISTLMSLGSSFTGDPQSASVVR
jgi:hypothetical protein